MKGGDELNHLSQKLQSKKGATLLIVIVFMMFCVFIGGSVLAAATANASRLKRSIATEQAYLSQRSAALLIAEQLYSADPVEFDIIPMEDSADSAVVELSSDSSSKLRTLASACAVENYLNSPEGGGLFYLRNYATSQIRSNESGGTSVDFSLRLNDPQEILYARLVCDTSCKMVVSFYDDAEYETMSDLLYLEMPKITVWNVTEVEQESAGLPDEAELGEEEEKEPIKHISACWGVPTVIKGGVEVK